MGNMVPMIQSLGCMIQALRYSTPPTTAISTMSRAPVMDPIWKRDTTAATIVSRSKLKYSFGRRSLRLSFLLENENSDPSVCLLPDGHGRPMGNAGACPTLPVIGRLTGHGVLLISVGLKKMFYLQIILVTGEENPLQEESEDLASKFTSPCLPSLGQS